MVLFDISSIGSSIGDDFGVYLWYLIAAAALLVYLKTKFGTKVSRLLSPSSSATAVRTSSTDERIRLKRLQQQAAWESEAQRVYEEEKKKKMEKLNKKKEEKYNDQLNKEEKESDNEDDGFYKKSSGKSGFQPWLDSSGPTGGVGRGNIRGVMRPAAAACNTGG
jgi:hypothetical protein